MFPAFFATAIPGSEKRKEPYAGGHMALGLSGSHRDGMIMSALSGLWQGKGLGSVIWFTGQKRMEVFWIGTLPGKRTGELCAKIRTS
jgi:hypothetical protein